MRSAPIRTLRAAASRPPRATRVSFLFLHQLRLHRSGELRGEIDVARQARLALDRVRLARRRVLERTRREVRGRRLLAATCERNGPVDRETSVVVLGGDGEQLEGRVLGVLLLPEAAEHVAVRGRERRDLPTALAELGQS